jgi:hypothetical protein
MEKKGGRSNLRVAVATIPIIFGLAHEDNRWKVLHFKKNNILHRVWWWADKITGDDLITVSRGSFRCHFRWQHQSDL